MQTTQSVWKQNDDWKARYTKLYSSHRVFRLVPKHAEEADPRRISFMSNEATPYASLLMRMRTTRRDTTIYGGDLKSSPDITTLMSAQSDPHDSCTNYARPDDLGGTETLLLDMVRRKSREYEEAQDKTLALPQDDIVSDELGYINAQTILMMVSNGRNPKRERMGKRVADLLGPSSEACVHGLSMRTTERSISRSRSRMSRISTRRDMDIPSILAFETHVVPAPAPLEIPGLQKISTSQNDDLPRWSIRRSICPVCSQKWRDKSSINNVKSSGLKRNSSAELPSVIAPARLRASITMAYVPRPVVAAVDEAVAGRAMRNTSASWQLTRARRFRVPKPQVPSPEAIAPPSSTAPMARKDLDIRVNRFLNDEGMAKNVVS